MTFGNIIFEGLIGVAIDAGSGAMTQYDSRYCLMAHRGAEACTYEFHASQFPQGPPVILR